MEGILGFTGYANWSDFEGSVPYAMNIWNNIDRPVFWTIPLIVTGATLDDAAAGLFDSHYTAAATSLAVFRPGDAQINVRVGWELNGNWFPWAAQGHEAAYISAYRRFVACFRAVSSRFVFEWNVNCGGSWDPSTAYPGDDVVDIIGMDVYWQTQFDGTDPIVAWKNKVTQSWGLAWHQQFAAQRGKPTSYPEWGIQSDLAAPYIELMGQWFVAHKVKFQAYWNSASSFNGQLSNDQYPTAGAWYKRVLGP